MIITRIKLDNFCSFRDAELDLTFSRPPSNTTIPYEYLEDYPKFYFKRVCILSGGNASGKTSLGRLLMHLQNALFNSTSFLSVVDLTSLRTYIDRKTHPAGIELEFVTPESGRIHVLNIRFPSTEVQPGSKPDAPKPELDYISVPLPKSRGVRAAREKLSGARTDPTVRFVHYTHIESDDPAYPLKIFELSDYIEGHSKNCGWSYLLSSNVSKLHLLNEQLDLKVLNAVLKTFDPSIQAVLDSRDDEGHNGFSIKFRNGDTVLIDKDNQVTRGERLSKGTFDALKLVELLSQVISEGRNGGETTADYYSSTYYVDESMAFAHTELEQAVVNLIIEKLGRHSQFFYTTHNYDVLDMNLPVHSYVFLRKDSQGFSSFVNAESLFNRNDRRLLNYVKNDVYRTLPDTTDLDGLLYE